MDHLDDETGAFIPGHSDTEGEADVYYKLQKRAGGLMAIMMVRDGDCRDQAQVLQLSPKDAEGQDVRTVLEKIIAKLEKEDFKMTSLLKDSDNLMKAKKRARKLRGKLLKKG